MKPPRQIGLSSATALVVATMIGTGVFTTSGFLLADLKSPWLVLAVWVVGGVMAALGALSYGALARRIPESGGEYLFLSRTLHPAAGYVAGWVTLFVGFAAPVAASAFAFGEYTKAWTLWKPQCSGTLLVLAFTAIHAAHVRRGAWLQNAGIIIEVALLIGFAVLALPRVHFTPPAPHEAASLGAFGVSLVWVTYSYTGWNSAVYIGGEVIAPERNLPRSLLLGSALVTLLYLALNAVFVFAAPVGELAGKLEIGRAAAQAVGGSTWADAVTALIALVLMMSVSSLVMAGPRVCAKMAADGYLPRWLAAREGPPRAAIACQSVLALTMLWTATFQSLLTYVGFTLSLSTAATVAGLMVLKRREGDSLPVPGWPWVPMLFLAAVLLMTGFTVLQRPLESGAALATISIGWLAWWGNYRRRRMI